MSIVSKRRIILKSPSSLVSTPLDVFIETIGTNEIRISMVMRSLLLGTVAVLPTSRYVNYECTRFQYRGLHPRPGDI